MAYGWLCLRWFTWWGDRRRGCNPGLERSVRMSTEPDFIESPRPTAAPLVLALGLTLLAAGVPFGLGYLVAGAVVVVGLVMPLPALLWGLLSGHSLWYPVNLLAGMALPGVGAMDEAALGQFHFTLLLVALAIHVALSVVIGLVYGVLLPTLPAVPRSLAWGGLLMP